MQKITLLFLVSFAFILRSEAQNDNEGLMTGFTFDFRTGSNVFIRDYKNNAQKIDSVMNMLSVGANIKIDSMVIVGSASPDGAPYINKSLAPERAINVWGFFKWKMPHIQDIPHRLIFVQNSWQDVIDAINADMSTPHQKEVVALIEYYNDPWALERIRYRYPDAYTYIYKDVMPSIRNVMACVIYYTPSVLKLVDEPKDLLVKVIPDVKDYRLSIEVPDMFVKKPLFAIKTNLLFDAATLINLELEVPIGKRFSIAAEVISPWWLWESKQRCLQFVNGNLELRYWFGNRYKTRSGDDRKVMTGWFGGIYAGGGYYDLEWNSKGYQGEFFIMAGLSGGYAHSIGRNLRMEYSLGVGYLKTNYRYYEARMNSDNEWSLYRQTDGKFSWIGPTRAKVSLVWMINANKKRKGDAR